MLILRDPLRDALALVSKAASSGTTLPILACIELQAEKDGLTLTANNLEMVIRTRINAQAQSAALALSPKITALNESELEINAAENFDADRPWQNYLQRLTAKR